MNYRKTYAKVVRTEGTNLTNGQVLFVNIYDTGYVRPLEGRNKGRTYLASRFKDIKPTFKFEPMKMNDNYPVPVYTIIDRNDPETSAVGLTKEKAMKLIEDCGLEQEISEGWVLIYKTEYINGQLRTLEITDDITFKVTLP